MIIKEAKALRVILKHFNPLNEMMLPEAEQKAIKLLRKSVEQKMKEYPGHFKDNNHNGG